jgi:magnesium-transporting ATPase (P-type)
MSILARIGKCVLLNGVIGGAAAGLTFKLSSGFASASEKLRQEFADASDGGESVLTALEQARVSLLMWSGSVALIVALAAALLIVHSQSQEPRDYDEATAQQGKWWLMFLVVLALMGLVWWQKASTANVGWMLVTSNYAVICVTIFLCAVLAFYLSTALFIKRSMVRAVPLGEFVRPASWS